MKQELEKTITNLKKSFKNGGLEFDGQPKIFFEMINDQEIQNAIVSVMKKKLAVNQQERSLITGFTSDGRRLHC